MHVDSCINAHWLRLVTTAINDSISLKIIEMTIPTDSISPIKVKAVTVNRTTHTKASAADSLSVLKNGNIDIKSHVINADKTEAKPDRTWPAALFGTAVIILITLLTIKHLFKQ